MIGHKPVVLIVDDESGILRLLDTWLSKNGLQVLSASNCESALRACRDAAASGRLAAAPDILLCDVVLPDRSGPLLAQELLALYPGMRVVFMSGWDADHLQRHGLPCGCDLLNKPFKMEEAIALIRHALAGSRGRVPRALTPLPAPGRGFGLAAGEYWNPGNPEDVRLAPVCE